MKILHLAYFGRFGKVTGIGESVKNLVKFQQKQGHLVKVLIPFPNPLVDDVSIFFSKSFDFAIKFISKFNPDIVVFDGMYDKYQIRLSFYLKLRDIPYVLVFHGGASADNAKKNKMKKKIANFLFFNRFVRWADKVVYLSEKEKSKSIFTKVNSNYSIIPNGVNLPQNIKKKRHEGKIRIVFLSRLDWYGKGLDVLCDVIKMFDKKEGEKNLQFLFYGPKESLECENLFQYGDLSMYCGYVTGEKKDKAFMNADIFILPSRSEGMPMSVLEALSYGVPCIVTPETNMSDLIIKNECGWVVNLSVQDIYKTIDGILMDFDNQRENLYANCIGIAKQYDWQVVANKSINVYNEVIQNRRNLK